MTAILAAALLFGAAMPGADIYLAAHEAERGARYAEAIALYETCAQNPGPLAAYARVKKTFCRAASGDWDGAVEAYRELLRGTADGPWMRMARIYLADALARRNTFEEAAKEYAAALDFQPKPWWAQSYERMAADVYIECPALRDTGYGFYRHVVATTRLRSPRLEAAERLAQSPEKADLLAAAQGYIKTGEFRPALPLLLRTAPTGLDWTAWLGGLGSKTAPPGKTELNRVAALPEDGAVSAWTREWLYYIARSQTAGDNLTAAEMACEQLIRRFPLSDEASDAAWALSLRLAKAGETLRANSWRRRIDETNPAHSRADDALFALLELAQKDGDVHAMIRTCRLLAERHPDSALLAKAWYWTGLALEKTGEKKGAGDAFAKAAAAGPGDFYAHRALARLPGNRGKIVPVNGEAPFLRTMAVPADPQPALKPIMLESPRFRRIAFFAEHGLEEAEWEAIALLPLLDKDPAAPAIYAMLGQAGLAYTAMNIAEAYKWGENGTEKSPARWRILYPRAYWPRVCEIAKEDGLDPYLILAVARQESTFRPALTSHAGASGVMQIMPATARHLTGSESDFDAAMADNLENPIHSLRLGARYLKRMLERWDGNVAYALASYNAGPGNCSKWKKTMGNVPLETFIESIPFDETRDYVKKVLANYAAYLSLYQ